MLFCWVVGANYEIEGTYFGWFGAQSHGLDCRYPDGVGLQPLREELGTFTTNVLISMSAQSAFEVISQWIINAIQVKSKWRRRSVVRSK